MKCINCIKCTKCLIHKVSEVYQDKSTKIQAWNPKVSLLVLPSPPESLDGPPGGQIGRNKHAKSYVLGTETDNIRAQTHHGL